MQHRNHRRRAAALGLVLGTALPALAACGNGTSADPSASHTMPDGTVMSGSSMPRMDGSRPMGGMGESHGAAAPSPVAAMICGAEIRDAVRRAFALARTPVGLHSWSHRLFRCTYQLGGGELRLSVKDLDTAGPGRAYFDDLRRRLRGAADIKGMASFGFPAFETPRGDVVFIKDDKTLWVDATRLGARDLPGGQTRQDIAYAVAAAVIGCWTE